MVRTVFAKDIKLHELETIFNLREVDAENFFEEWQENLPETTQDEKKLLDRVKANYRNLIKYPPLLENAVKMVVLSPLLDLSGFYQSPFRISTEPSVEIVSEDEGVIVKGQIDVLVLNDDIWILVIESKRAEFSIEAARAQILAYMLRNAGTDKPTFGLITNGGSFVFVKLVKQDTPLYTLSRMFSIINPGNELYSVLSILKRLGSFFV